ncbi:MAG: YggT family protein [bacterium]|nr:YggT family protein [bacterium]
MDEEKRTVEVEETTHQDGNTAINKRAVSKSTETSGLVVFQRVVWFLLGVIVILLAFRVVLLLLAANEGTAFVDFIYTLGGLFAAPFYGIFSYEPSYGKSVFEISSVVAMAVYAVVAWGINKLATLTRPGEEI